MFSNEFVMGVVVALVIGWVIRHGQDWLPWMRTGRPSLPAAPPARADSAAGEGVLWQLLREQMRENARLRGGYPPSEVPPTPPPSSPGAVPAAGVQEIQVPIKFRAVSFDAPPDPAA